MAKQMITAETVIHELEAYIYKELVQRYEEKIALACVDSMFKCLHLNFRSNLMYIPLSNRLSINSLNESIYRNFTGNNHKELAIKFNRSEQTIYSIVNKYRTKEIRKLQNDIFPLPNEEITKPVTLKVIEDYLPNDFIKCGLSKDDANAVAKNLSIYLCQKFPGISIVISDKLQKKRVNKDQLSLF